MSPRETLEQINALTETLIGLSLCNEQQYPSTHGDMRAAFEITIGAAENLTVALKNIPYRDIYNEIEKAKCFNIKMLDGGLLILRYRFRSGVVCEHSLSYFSSPDLEHFQNEPELYLEDVVYADIVAKSIVPFPIRFDYSDDARKFIDVHHPFSHLTLGQYQNCRIPVCSPVAPLTFGGFVLRNFYNTAFRKYSDELPPSSLALIKTITANEQQIPHLVCRV
jgi:hypothetical protein